MLFRRGNAQRDRFEKMAEEVFPNLLGTAIRLTKNSDDAQDLAQQAVIRAYEAFDRFDGRNFKAWMLRILTNLYINTYRQRQRAGLASSLDDENAAEPVDDVAYVPDRQLFDNMVGGEVQAALAKVPEVFRMAVLLSDVEELSYEEIAEITDVPIGTVRSRIARGRAILRKELERYARAEGYLRQSSTDSP